MGIYETPHERFGMLDYQIWRRAAGRGHRHSLARLEPGTSDRLVSDHTTLSRHEVESEVDRYISWPAQALSYYLGEACIRDCRRKAQSTLGASFDVRDFHDAILSVGSVPLETLRSATDRLIRDHPRTPPELSKQQMSMASLNHFIGGRARRNAAGYRHLGRDHALHRQGDLPHARRRRSGRGRRRERGRRGLSDKRWKGSRLRYARRFCSAGPTRSRHAGALDQLDAEDMGKPVSVAAFNARSAASLMRFNAESIDKVFGQTLPSAQRSLVVQRWAPRGVVAAITPWNFPTFNAVLKMAPALAAGNTVVVQAFGTVAAFRLELARLAIEAGLPAGALNIVLGKGEIVGKALSLHHGVNMVSFTGSSEVGKLVLGYAAQSNM